MPRVRLRPIAVADAERCYLWESDPDVVRYLGLVHSPVSVEHQRTLIANLLADHAHQRGFIILDEHERAIGSCSLRGIDKAAGTALLGILIGHRADWGQGYGTAAAKALLAYAFGELALREIRLSCHASNRRAIRCYQKAGFEPSTHQPPRRVFGAHELCMAITRARWEQLQAKGEGEVSRPQEGSSAEGYLDRGGTRRYQRVGHATTGPPSRGHPGPRTGMTNGVVQKSGDGG